MPKARGFGATLIALAVPCFVAGFLVNGLAYLVALILLVAGVFFVAIGKPG